MVVRNDSQYKQCLLAKNPAKQDGVVYRIPYVYIVETGRPMQDWIKEHDREIRLTHSQTSTVSEHDHNTGHQLLWNEIKFIDRVPHYYTPKVKGAIHIRLRSDNINRDGGVEIPEAWMPTIRKKHNRRAVQNGPPRNKSAKRRGNAPGKYVLHYQVSKHIMFNDVIVLTGITGIRTKRINGIRDILAKN